MIRISASAAGALVAGFVGATVWADSRPYAMPDPAMTPGLAATTDPVEICASDGQAGSSYSRAHRHTTYDMKLAVAYAYDLPRRNWHTVEFDHLIPLCLGGADDTRNIWSQPIEEARVKDRAEAAACREACRGHMDAAGIKQLQAAFASDWRAAYRKVMGSAP